MTEQAKKQLQDKFFESNTIDDVGSIVFFKDPIKVTGTLLGMQNNMSLIESFIKLNDNYYYNNNHFFDQNISINIYDDDNNDLDEISQEGVCVLSIQVNDNSVIIA